MSNLSWRSIGILLLVGLALWLPRAFELHRFVVTDEVPWVWRSANFYYALSQRDFNATYLSDHPGVVTMWVETVAFLLEFPEYRGFGQGMFDKYLLLEGFLESNGVYPHDIIVIGRTLTVLLNTVLITAAFAFAWSLFGFVPALVGFLLIAFDPFHIGITRLSHLDGPLGSFLLLSLLAFLAYLYSDRRISYLLLSAVAGGLSVLAKLPGFLIVPSVGLITLVNYVYENRGGGEEQNKQRSFLTKELIKPLAFWSLIFLLPLIVFFPVMWVSPIEGFKKLLFSPLGIAGVINDSSLQVGNELGLGAELWSYISQQPIGYYLRYPEKFLWRTTPVVLFGLTSALFAYKNRSRVFAGRKVRDGVRGLIIFAVVYTLFMTVPPRTSDKYYIPVFAVLDLVAGIGWVAFADWVVRLTALAGKRYIRVAIISLAALFQLVGALRTFPYYLTYFNPILGGSQRAGVMMPLGSGEGLDLVAKYLNTKPDAETLKTMSWYGIGPLSFFFVGETLPISVGEGVWNDELAFELKGADFLVVYNKQWHNRLPRGLLPYLQGIEPEHSVWINGIEYARIYNVNTLPPELFDPIE